MTRTEGDVPVETAKKLDALGRILSNGSIDSGTQIARMLSYVVEREIEGDADRLKAYAIGQDVFDRGPGFDPSSDSIVRVEMKRLRSALAHHYATRGAEDPVELSIPKGSYVPKYVRKAAVARPKAPATVPAFSTRSPVAWRGRWLVGGAVAVAIALAAGVLRVAMPVEPRHRPMLTLQLSSDGDLAARVEPSAAEVLSRFRALQLVDPDEVGEPLPEDYAVHLSSVSTEGYASRAPRGAEQRAAARQYLSDTLEPPAGRSGVTASLIHLASGTTVETARFSHTELGERLTETGITPLTLWLGQLASQRGMAFSDYIDRGKLSPPLRCIALMERYFDRQSDARHAAARDCLDDLDGTAAMGARLDIARAYLAREEFTDRRNMLDGDPLARAAHHARAAIAADPSDAEAHYAFMTVLFLLGSETKARQQGEVAVDLNPFDGELLGGVATRLNNIGEHTRALELFRRSELLFPVSASWIDHGIFLAFYGLGNMEEAAGRALSLRGTENPLHLADLAIAYDHLGDAPLASAAIARLLQHEPEPRRMYERRRYDPDLTDRLVADLDRIARASAGEGPR